MRYFSFLLFLITLASCQSESREVDMGPVTEVDDILTSVDEPTGADALRGGGSFDMTEEELTAFAEEIERSFIEGDGSYFSDHFDPAEILEYALQDINMPSYQKNLAVSMAANQFDMAADIYTEVQAGGTYRYVNHKMEDGYATINFRQTGMDGMNYHTLYIETKAGEPAIYDIFIYMTGEELSKSMRELMSGLLGTGSSPSMDQALRINSIQTALESGDADKALSELDKLPRSVQQQKMVKALAISLAGMVDDEKYQEVMERFELAEDSLSIQLTDLYIMREDWEKAHRSLDYVDESLGGDPYINIMHANVYAMEGDTDKAEEAMDALNGELEDMEDFTWAWLSIEVAKKDYKAAVEHVDKLVNSFDYEAWSINLAFTTEYPDFVESRPFKDWYADH